MSERRRIAEYILGLTYTEAIIAEEWLKLVAAREAGKPDYQSPLACMSIEQAERVIAGLEAVAGSLAVSAPRPTDRKQEIST